MTPKFAFNSPEDTGQLVENMLGGTERFIETDWRKQPYYAPGSCTELIGAYGIDAYLSDLQKVFPKPYAAVKVQDGARYFSQHETTDSLREAIAEGSVSATKLSRFWHHNCPENWLWIRTLYGALCARLMAIYLTPDRSEDVDVFLAGDNSGLGAHFDSTDVFTIQLVGERRWEVDQSLDVEAMVATMRAPDWFPAKEVEFQGATKEIILRPGDAFYVPAYCVHKVTGVSWSVSLSLGLRAFNEFDVLETLVETLKLRAYTDHTPLNVFPESATEAYTGAKLEMIQRVRSLLAEVDKAAIGSLLQPLTLPADLDANAPPKGPASKSGVYRSGFALNCDDR